MTAISSNRADKKAEKLLEREIARKKRKLQKTTAFDVFNIIFLLILAFIINLAAKLAGKKLRKN